MPARSAGALREYNRKRDFSRTAEPKGAVRRRKATGQGLGYLIQKHDATRLHYDFRLELDGVLKSWAVTRGPSSDPGQKRLAVRTEDHPLDYGSFEGTIPKGQYGGGTVMLWDRGRWEPKGDPHEGLAQGKLSFLLHGERLQGSWALVRMRPRGGEKRENWLLVKERDDWADQAEEPVERYETSVVTGRRMAEIAAGTGPGGSRVWHSNRADGGAPPLPVPPPARRKSGGAAPAKRGRKDAPPMRGTARPCFVAPQLATLVAAPPQGEDWLHEIKWDGYRLIAVIDGERVRLYTRNRKDWSDRFEAVLPALRGLPVRSAVLDGEVVALSGEGAGGMPRSDFAALQQALQSRAPLCFVTFDLLHLDGEDLRRRPLVERKAELQALVGAGMAAARGELRYCDHIRGQGAEVHANACRLALEGIVSKRADAPYRSGRQKDWLKVKCARREEFVIGGWAPSDKKGRPFASLLLGSFEDGRFVYRGRVGTGFDGRTMQALAAAMQPLARRTPAYDDRLPAAQRRGVRWVEPRLVAEIAYAERTPDGLLRHPSFQGLREDKAAGEVHLERPQAPRQAATRPKRAGAPSRPAGIRLTSPDKLLYPEAGVSKGDLAAYFLAVAEVMLPHVAGRPVSLVRCPDGVSGECFFQRHRMQGMPEAIRTVPVREKKGGGRRDYLYVEDAAGLAALAQIGALEVHVWGAPVADVERPDRLVFDLDPDEGLPFAAVRQAARDLRDLLAAAQLQSFPLLTGGKGVHVVVPLLPERPWQEVKAFARGFAARLAADQPDRFLAKASKQARRGRIFLDWMRNERGATAIAPFSPRARPAAPVAVPVSWAELARAEGAAAWDLRSLPQRLKRLRRDPWGGYFDSRQRIADPTLALFAGGGAQSPRRSRNAPDFADWTKQALYARARTQGIPGRSGMTRAELIEALQAR